MGWTNSSGWTTGAGGWNKAAAAGGSPVVYTYDFIANPSLPAELSLSRATSGTNFNTSGTLVTAATNASRFENVYNGSAWVKAGLLVESQKTNYLSSDISNATYWLAESAHMTIGTASTSLDGTSDAYPVIPTTANFYHHYYQGASGTPLTTASPVSFSIYSKPDGYTQTAIRESAATGAAASFTLSGSGTALSVFSAGGLTVTSSAIKALSGSWYRTSALMTPSGSQGFTMGLYVMDGGFTGGNPNSYGFAGDGINMVTDFGAQMEVGGFASSYIPTTGVAVTRSADLLSSNSPLTGYLAAGPSVWELTDLATGATTRTSFAAGAFTFPADKLYRSFGVYPSGTDTTPYLTVGGAY